MNIKEMLITPNKYSRPQTKIGTIKNIVIHWVGNAGSTAENNAKYFDGLKVGKKNTAGSYIYASSHYIIGNDGTTIRCIPENEVAYHASKANSYSIGIEMCHPDNTGKPTQKTYDALVELVGQLCHKYKLKPIQAIIRHYDVTGKLCPKYYVENEKAFKQLREDVERYIAKDEELEKAVEVLMQSGIISMPEVWREVDKINLRNVVSLITKLGQKQFGLSDYDEIVDRLIAEGIISLPKIWKQRTYSKGNVRDLIVKLANS